MIESACEILNKKRSTRESTYNAKLKTKNYSATKLFQNLNPNVTTTLLLEVVSLAGLTAKFGFLSAIGFELYG